VFDVERIVKPLNQLVFVAFEARRTEGASLIANEQAEGPRANTQRSEARTNGVDPGVEAATQLPL